MFKRVFLAVKTVAIAGAACLALMTTPLYADQATSVKRLSELLGKAETLEGRFSQMTLDSAGSYMQETNGSMVLKRPGLFYWHTDAPMEQELISNGKKIWLYDPDLMQVTVQAMDQRLTHTPALLLSGDLSKITESFSVSHQEGGSVVDFTLKPLDPETLFETLRLSFRNGLINDMQLVDGLGQRTNILFSAVKMNQPVDAKRFEFVIPKGVDVIEE